MRLQILSVLFPFFVLVLATSKAEDKSNIEDITAAFNFIFDRKEFNKLSTIFTPDITYGGGGDPVQGLSNAISLLSNIIPNTTTSYTILSTQLINFLPPFDKDGRSKFAESVSYSTFVNFGGGEFEGQTLIAFGRFVDKEIVRTKEPGFGGWRFKDRRIEAVVSFPPNTPPPQKINKQLVFAA